MSMRRSLCRRRGITLVETSLVSSVALLLLLGVVTVGLGIFQQQQLNWLAREGAQWAAMHGGKYQQENNASPPTSGDILTHVVNPKLVGISSGSIACTLSMNSNKATVTLTYTWVPESVLPPMQLKSTSVMPITY